MWAENNKDQNLDQNNLKGQNDSKNDLHFLLKIKKLGFSAVHVFFTFAKGFSFCDVSGSKKSLCCNYFYVLCSICTRDVTGLNFTGFPDPDFYLILKCRIPEPDSRFLGVGKIFDYLCNRVVFCFFFLPTFHENFKFLKNRPYDSNKILQSFSTP